LLILSSDFVRGPYFKPVLFLKRKQYFYSFINKSAS
jgi:hypothetical protein